VLISEEFLFVSELHTRVTRASREKSFVSHEPKVKKKSRRNRKKQAELLTANLILKIVSALQRRE
jgi:hypothetical protein